MHAKLKVPSGVVTLRSSPVQKHRSKVITALLEKPVRPATRIRSNNERDLHQNLETKGATELPKQGDAMVAGIDPIDYINRQLQDILKPPSTLNN